MSYFDHVLSKEEYVNAEFVYYGDFIDHPDKLNIQVFNAIKAKFVLFYRELYYLAEKNVYLNGKKGFIQINSYDRYKKHIIKSMRERPLCEILFPSLYVYDLTGYDLTHVFLILRDEHGQENKMQKIITDIANSVGLHTYY